MLIDKFESKINRSVRGLSYSDFDNIFKDDNLVKEFLNTDTVNEFADEVIKINTNKDVVELMSACKYTNQLYQTELKIDEIFKSYKNKTIDRSTLLKKMEELRKSPESLEKLSAILCTMMALSDVDVSDMHDEILSCFEEIHKMLTLLENTKAYYILKADLIDLVYQFCEWYFTSYKINLLKGVEWIKEETDKINDFENEMLPEIPDSKTNPEKFGYIDITKLKGKE